MKRFKEYVISLAKAGFESWYVWGDFTQKRSKKWKNVSLEQGRFIILSVYHDLKLGA